MTQTIFLPGAYWVRQISDAEWSELESAAAISLSLEHRTALQNAFSKYQAAVEMNQEAIRPAGVRCILEGLIKEAGMIGVTLSAVAAPRSREWEAAVQEMQFAALARGDDIDGKGALDGVEIQKMAEHLKQLSEYARSAVNRLPDGIGAKSDPGLPTFLLEIHAIFTEAGGLGTYTPTSLRFLKEACVIAGVRRQNIWDRSGRDLAERWPHLVG